MSTSPRTPETATEPRSTPLEAEALRSRQLELLFHYALPGFAISLANALLFAFLARRSIPGPLIHAWLAAMVLAMALRFALVTSWRSRRSRLPDTAWLALFVAGTAVAGLLWGGSAFFFYPYLPPLHLVFHILLIGGMAAGAAATLSFIYPCYLCYALGCVFPPILYLFLTPDDPDHPAMAVLITLFLGLMLLVARRMNQSYNTTFHLESRNLGLVKAISESELRFRTLTTHSPTAVFIIQNNHFVYTNPACEEMTGCTREELAQMPFLDLVHPDFRQEVALRAASRISPQGGDEPLRRYEFMIIHRDGQERWLDFTGIRIQHQNGPAILGNAIDITKRKTIEHKLREQATTDDLTGLANRREFTRRAEEEVYRSRRYGRPLSLIWLDIDHFKRVNDTYGHQAGDGALIAICAILADAVRETDVLARMGGEEFTVMLPETNLDQAHAMAIRLRDRVLESPIPIPGLDEPLSMTISLGVSELGRTVTTLNDLMAAADHAMYQAKQEGRNRVRSWRDHPPGA